jgi:carbamoyltransferase
MIVLGINGGVRAGYQDVSAVLLRDGLVVAAVEEERLSRVKHSAGQLPFLAVHEVLSIGGISMKEVDVIATHGSTWGEQYEDVLTEYFTYNFGRCPRISRYHHHLCHAASAYYASGMDKAMIITVDASGDGISLQKAIGRGDKLEVFDQISRDNSLGLLYAMMTQFCGFMRDTDEYKLMGLAPYGNRERCDLSFLLECGNGTYQVNADYMKQYAPGQPQGSRQQAVFNRHLTHRLGSPRIPGSAMDERFLDIAASTQHLLENAMCEVVRGMAAQTGLRKLCLAGGVALNCAANRRILALDCLDELYVQPAAGDAGISLGAAYLASSEAGIRPRPMTTAKLGREFSSLETEDSLNKLGIRHQKVSQPWSVAADLILNDKVLGWVEGRAEFGPRALGSRSILASPFNPEMKDIINHRIKFREGFRPFCPSVLESDFKKAFTSSCSVLPFMTINVDVVSDEFPSVTHLDRTARVQTVSPDDEGNFPKVLQTVKEVKGTGMVVNTSFNRNREPMVYSVMDAVSAFYGSGMDALIVGDFLILKG